MKLLSETELRQILLSIAIEFDRICMEHKIPYYMLGGTMLGAIRHKGFIPWDDDMDFGVPIDYFPQVIKCLEEQLPDNLKCCTFSNSQSVFYPFVKIADTRTIIDDRQLPTSLEDKIGINVDVFPLFPCDSKDKRIKKVWLLLDIYGKIYTDSRSRGIVTNGVKRLLRYLCPFSKKFFYNNLKKRVWHLQKEGDVLGNIFGRWREKELIPVSWYGENVRYEFDKVSLCGIKEYDKYLKKLYGNYMKLPSIEKRQCDHVAAFYWKE